VKRASTGSIVDELSVWTDDPGRIILWQREWPHKYEEVYYIAHADYDTVAAMELKETEQERSRNQSKLD
jgi:hypothetical protein